MKTETIAIHAGYETDHQIRGGTDLPDCGL